VDLRGAESRHAKEIEETGGRGCAELLEIPRLARLDQIAHDGERGGADALRLRQLAAAGEGREIVRVERDERRGGLLVRAHLEGALAGQLEVRGDLSEHVRRGA